LEFVCEIVRIGFLGKRASLTLKFHFYKTSHFASPRCTQTFHSLDKQEKNMATSQTPQGSQPVAIVCVGMAGTFDPNSTNHRTVPLTSTLGSGKTTFMQRINSYLHSKNEPPYVINLDPAVRNVPFDSNIDIRDSVNYKEVMKSYNLGPNGGILTSLNLFATKIDQILTLLEKRTTPNLEKLDAKPIKNILVDTPGQIEVFVWSASGSILLDSLASTFPTVIAYIIDTPRTASTSTFMSNMLYACSILYKTKLPMILVFNKTDVKDAEFAKEWMTDFESFQAALREEEETGSFGGMEGVASGMGGGSGYMGSLLNSMSLMLEEFYSHLSVVGISSMTGAGVNEFFEAVEEKAQEFERDYKPELERRKKEREAEKIANREKELGKLMKDMAISGEPSSRKLNTDMDTLSDMEDESEEEGGDVDKDEEDPEGLGARYKQALADSTPQTSSNDDHSFARYLRASQMNM
jgi:GTPase SAR1 family protein